MSTLRTITGFKSKLAGGGARPNLFEVEIPSFPIAAGANVWRTGDNQEAESIQVSCAKLLHFQHQILHQLMFHLEVEF